MPGLWSARHASGLFCPLWTPLPCLQKSDPRWLGENGCVCSVRWSRFVVVALGILGGIISPIQRRRSGATRRVDSSLRSHRTWWSECRHVYSGLNKTLFASVGPNLRCRGHRLRCPAKPGRSSASGRTTLPIGPNKTWSRSPTRRNAPGTIARTRAGHCWDSAARREWV